MSKANLLASARMGRGPTVRPPMALGTSGIRCSCSWLWDAFAEKFLRNKLYPHKCPTRRDFSFFDAATAGTSERWSTERGRPCQMRSRLSVGQLAVQKRLPIWNRLSFEGALREHEGEVMPNPP